MTYRPISFTLNGRDTTVEADPERLLLDVLRDDLRLKGTKRGCDNDGQCGTCTVVVGGRALRSCRLPVGKVEGVSVTTIEGVALSNGLHPLQQAFIDAGAVQCGYCTPGMIMSSLALLERNADPSRDQVSKALAGNLCRCTGYGSIVDAVMVAGAVMRGAPAGAAAQAASVIGGDARRHGAVGRVTGRAQYVGDIELEGMLHAAIVRSPHPHARILGIDPSAALASPGVRAVYTSTDIPGTGAFGDLWASGDQSTPEHPSQAREPVLASHRVRRVGEAVSMVVADSLEAAQQGCDLVQVRYEELPAVFDPNESLGDSPALHGTGNLYECSDLVSGGLGNAQAESDVEVTTEYVTPRQDHVPLETEAALGYIDDEGHLIVTGPTHQPHVQQRQIAEMLGLSMDRIRVIAPPLGGSFGGRHHFWPVVAVALPAYLLGAPVRLAYSRRETFEATLKSFPFRLQYRVGANRKGRLKALQAEAMGDAGPYGAAPSTAAFVAICGTGPYDWRAVDYRVRIAHTNGPNSGPLRGYAMPTAAVGIECTLDELARELGMDPWDLRRKNAIEPESNSMGVQFDEPFDLIQVLDVIKPHWDEIQATVRTARNERNGDWRSGAGLALSWYQFGKGGKLQTSAQAELGLDGKIVLYYTAMNSGQGLDTVMSQMAAETLGISRDRLRTINGDTDLTLDSNIYGACKSTYWVGGAVSEAASNLAQRLRQVATSVLEVPEDEIELSNEGVFERRDPRNIVSWARLADRFDAMGVPRMTTGTFSLQDQKPNSGGQPWLGHFTAGAAVVKVAVHSGTGKVRVEQVTIAQDVGRVINPIDVRGQIEGAAGMEISMALMEEYVVGETQDLTAYRIARSGEIPAILAIPVEIASRHGPFGAKGAAEGATGHVRAAVLNAIHDAAGVRIRRTPATPARIVAALKEKQAALPEVGAR